MKSMFKTLKQCNRMEKKNFQKISIRKKSEKKIVFNKCINDVTFFMFQNFNDREKQMILQIPCSQH